MPLTLSHSQQKIAWSRVTAHECMAPRNNGDRETEMQRLETPPRLRLLSHHGSKAFSAWADDDDDDDDEPKYTSLRDILVDYSPPQLSYVSVHDGLADFDPAAIPIRNQLVKHAASVYLQSAAILATRNQSCFSRFWRRVRRRAAALGSAWRGCAIGPVNFVSGSVRCILACLTGYVGYRSRVRK